MGDNDVRGASFADELVFIIQNKRCQQASTVPYQIFLFLGDFWRLSEIPVVGAFISAT